MSVFYFTDKEGNYYEMSSTMHVSLSESGRATTNPVESGKAITDNFVMEPRIITFSGLITNIKVIGQQEDRVKDVDQWINDIRTLRISKELVSVYVHDLNVIPNCLITTFDIDKNKSHGLSGWGCNMVFQEILISQRASQIDFPEAKPSVSDDVSSKRNSGNQTTSTVNESLVLSSGAILVDQVVGG